MKRFKKIAIEGALLFFALFPLLPNKMKGLPVIILLIVSFSFFDIKKIKLKLFFIYSFLFLLYILSLIYTTNIEYGYKKLETSLSILIIPLIFFILMPSYKIKKNTQNLFASLYVIFTTIFSLISILTILLDRTTSYYKDFYSNKFRIVVNDLPLIGQHPIYASLFLAIAILFNIYLIKIKRRSYLYIFLLINSSLLLMLSSKGVILSLMIIFIFFLWFIIKTTLQKKIFIFTLFLVFFSILFVSNRRMKELLIPKTYKTLNNNYSNSFRLNINECSIHLIKKNWFSGYGIGDVQDRLNTCYSKKNKILLEKTYNSHNQYFDIWLKTGIVGFLYFILFIIYLLYYHYKNKNYLLLSIILIFSINFIFENILDRQSGVIFFYFLISFFLIQNNSSEKLKYSKLTKKK